MNKRIQAVQLTKRELPHISRRECQIIYPKIFHNADRNWQAAQLLAKEGFYGQAISVATVSIEEAIKAIIIQLDGAGFNFRSAKGVSRFFNEHAIRHVTACVFLCIELIGDDLLKYFKRIHKSPSETQLFIQKIKDLQPLITDAVVYLQGKAKEMKSELPFFLSIEQSRQRGFYCDFENKFLSPEDLDETKYLEVLKKYGKIHNFIRGFSETFTNQSNEEISQLLQSFKDEQLYRHIGDYLKGMKAEQMFQQFLQLLDQVENLE
ncbi:AbiV family abortive infection protein [Pedobacter nyackensis]|uniref:Abortive infection protein, AbiV family n=1 Tax=Pedobacter nyackensis TaxID=475255 RepID=A0A1W2AIY6_9SPHI|nr:AbiV family abortive infection protein [Pedobacter nyackensis]SMC60520.1 abortive infection protein, AbiV family [Pedobacter nyackensis]